MLPCLSNGWQLMLVLSALFCSGLPVGSYGCNLSIQIWTLRFFAVFEFGTFTVQYYLLKPWHRAGTCTNIPCEVISGTPVVRIAPFHGGNRKSKSAAPRGLVQKSLPRTASTRRSALSCPVDCFVDWRMHLQLCCHETSEPKPDFPTDSLVFQVSRRGVAFASSAAVKCYECRAWSVQSLSEIGFQSQLVLLMTAGARESAG